MELENFNRVIKEVNTDFECLQPGQPFPPDNVRFRNMRFNFEKKLYDGSYANGKMLEVTCLDSMNRVIKKNLPYRVLTVNKFNLYVNKILSLYFGVSDFDYRARTDEDTEILRRLVERVGWVDSIMNAVTILETYGNCILRTYVGGVNAIPPTNGFLIVDKHDRNNIKAIVIYEILEEKQNNGIIKEYVRVELHCKGFMAERVYEYNFNGVLGEPVDYIYRGRLIKAEGNYYELPFDDVSAVEWMTIDRNRDESGVYGKSPFWDFAHLVFKLEELLSVEAFVTEANAKPLLAVSSSMLIADEKTGGYKLRKIETDGLDITPVRENENPPQFVSVPTSQLEHSRKLRDDIQSHIYELMEFNRAFMIGEYSGQISHDTLEGIIRGCIDRAQRHWWQMYTPIKNSLYCLARLNGLNIPYEDIEIIANIGVNESKKEMANISSILINNKILSRETVRMMYYGMTKDQSDAEEEKIKKEAMMYEAK